MGVGTGVGMSVGDAVGRAVGFGVSHTPLCALTIRQMPLSQSLPVMQTKPGAHGSQLPPQSTSVSVSAVSRPSLQVAGVGVVVGIAVGASVGADVGVAVGESVGTLEGCAVGPSVGIAVGAAVGTAVGAAVGKAVGTGVSHIPESMQMPLSQSLPNTQFRPGAQG